MKNNITKRHFLILKNYLISDTSLSGLSSNFQSCIQIVKKANESNVFTVKIVSNAISTDYHYISSLYNRTKLREGYSQARSALMNIEKHNRDIVFLSFYEGVNKFKSSTRQGFSITFFGELIDFSAVCFYLDSSQTIEEFEYKIENNKKLKSDLLISSKKLFEDALKEFVYEYRNREEKNKNLQAKKFKHN